MQLPTALRHTHFHLQDVNNVSLEQAPMQVRDEVNLLAGPRGQFHCYTFRRDKRKNQNR